ncbi:hypothetical protein EJ06DRAFT_531912 [Trichodelitschia bisporula]|uniref:DUF7719 domain-containing protein n=1 Tax=Trichodelitschia bisporula TaxID=703511 RepID=A0A6G1HSX0_9PEZI|nr:hypothetical protein EJ06DRAFT_531912 [Trichodelitschia bisporula]
MSTQPQNRKARRSPKPTSHLDQSTTVPMAQPDRSGPRGKTLYELAAERQAELQGGTPFQPEGRERDGDWEFMSDEPLGAGGEAVVYTILLGMLHFTLDVLVFHQYRQEVVWKEILLRTASMLPALFLLIWVLHTGWARRWAWVRQGVFFVVAVASGVYLVYAGNVFGYYAVMKRAPPVGTLWVWSVVEMDLTLAVVHLPVVAGYMWWNGFGMF